jgi:predicted nuclease with TOPRIM domain
MCFHSSTVCQLKPHIDAFEKLKKENAELKKCLFQMQNAAIDLVDKLKIAEKESSRLKDKLEIAKESLQNILDMELHSENCSIVLRHRTRSCDCWKSAVKDLIGAQL